MKGSPPVCAIDIGSNALRCGVGRINASGQLEMLMTERVALRLGAEVFTVGRLSLATIDKLATALRRFQEGTRKFQPKIVRAVATSALREARNRHEVLTRVTAETGIAIELIDGVEEARLVHDAVAHHLNLKGLQAVLLDIGGGSVEVSLVKNASIRHSESFRMGTVRLLSVADGDPSRQVRLLGRLVKQYSHRITADLNLEFERKPVDLLVGTGGNFESVGELAQKFCDSPSSSSISREHLEKVFSLLVKTPLSLRGKKFGLREDRTDVIVPALIVMREVMDVVGAKTLVIPGVGLREGIIIDLAASRGNRNHLGNLARQEHQRFFYALELGRRFSFGEAHGRQVAFLAEKLFDELQPLHRLDGSARSLLRTAALLHDIGQTITISAHHRHSFYIIRFLPLMGFTKRQRLLIALVARYHRKAAPSPKHKPFALLPPKERELVCKLASLLRIADALDRGHTSRVQNLSVQLARQSITLTLHHKGGDDLERWALQKKRKLFERVFRKKLKLTKGRINATKKEN